MAGITRLLVILEEDNRIKLELPNGIPSSVDKVIQKIKTVCGLPNEIRLQYYDADFGTWVNLTSTSELKDLASLKVIHVEPTVTLFFDPVDMSADKGNFHSQDDSCISASLDDLLPASSHSSNTYRKEQWPKRCRLERSGRDTHTDTPGSFNHSYGWKQRLKTKMYNYRTYLKSHSSSSDELTVNTMKRKSPMDAHPAKNIKKPRRAESNHYPSLPLNETPESMEQERIALLSEVKKKNNVKTIREKMAQTFAFIKQEIVDKKTSLLSIIERWPGLLEVQEVNAEFLRVTTIPLEAKFMEKLDERCSELMQVVRKKGGAIREKTKLLPIVEKDTDVAVKREIALKSITVYMGEEVEDLIKDFLVSEKEEAEQVLQQETIAIVKRVKRF